MVLGAWTHDEFMEEARKFHSYAAPGIMIGGYMVEAAKKSLPQGILYEAICETGQCLPDAVQLLTPCTIGNGWMRIHNFGLYALSLFDKHSGEGVRVNLDVEKLTNFPEIRGWFLKEKPKSEQDNDRLQEEIRLAAQSIFNIRQIKVLPQALNTKGKGKTDLCPMCKECYPIVHGSSCLSCQGQSPYAQTGG